MKRMLTLQAMKQGGMMVTLKHLPRDLRAKIRQSTLDRGWENMSDELCLTCADGTELCFSYSIIPDLDSQAVERNIYTINALLGSLHKRISTLECRFAA